MWTNPSDLPADHRSAACTAGCSKPTAATKVNAEMARFTRSRIKSEQVLLRSGKKRSAMNSNAKTVTAMKGVGRSFILKNDLYERPAAGGAVACSAAEAMVVDGYQAALEPF